MREIKFRAWHKINGMTHSFCVHSSGLIAYKNNEWLDEKPIIMQYTGLKDKNGKEIYEGDIIKDGSGDIGFIKFDNGCFIYSQDNIPLAYCIKEGDIEMCRTDNFATIIGNIHENPELLEVK